jgi:hypothetical protein
MMQAPVLAASPNGEEFELVPMMERTGPEVLHSYFISTNMGKGRASMSILLYI